MPIRQADAPNQCSSANKSVDKLLWYWHTCIALRVLRYASQFVILLAAHTAFVTAATCVLHAASFTSSLVPLHYTTFVACPFSTRHGTLSHTQSKAQVLHIPFRKAIATIFTGFHSASLRPTFTSVAFSPPAAKNCARLVCLPQLRVCHGFWPKTQRLDTFFLRKESKTKKNFLYVGSIPVREYKYSSYAIFIVRNNPRLYYLRRYNAL